MDDRIIEVLNQLRTDGPQNLSNVITMTGTSMGYYAGLITIDDTDPKNRLFRISELGEAALGALIPPPPPLPEEPSWQVWKL